MPGFSWTELYTMPVDLRRFYFKLTSNKIKKHNEHIEEQNKKIKQAQARIPRKK